ncbi:MAG: class I SAM-dependent methyltransferase [Hyphomicrobiaceae bacterium]
MLFQKKVLSSLSIAVCLATALPGIGIAQENATSGMSVESILAAQPAEIKERYGARHPLETLKFCEVKAGDAIIETLPGRGWYSGILYPLAGKTGRLIGAQYPESMFERIGLPKERIKTILERNAKWKGTTASQSVGSGGRIESYTMTEMPDSLKGVADKVLFIRSLHNLSRLNKETGYLTKSISEALAALKPGGIVCIVQHRAPETASDDWANGSKGYLKQSKLISLFKDAGFKFVEAQEINANPKDRPTETDSVWRLPPSLRGTEPDSPEWKKNKEVGESDRMTLKFMKPTS